MVMATLLPSLVLTASSLISPLQAPKRDIIIITPLISFYLSSSGQQQQIQQRRRRSLSKGQKHNNNGDCGRGPSPSHAPLHPSLSND